MGYNTISSEAFSGTGFSLAHYNVIPSTFSISGSYNEQVNYNTSGTTSCSGYMNTANCGYPSGGDNPTLSISFYDNCSNSVSFSWSGGVNNSGDMGSSGDWTASYQGGGSVYLNTSNPGCGTIQNSEVSWSWSGSSNSSHSSNLSDNGSGTLTVSSGEGWSGTINYDTGEITLSANGGSPTGTCAYHYTAITSIDTEVKGASEIILSWDDVPATGTSYDLSSNLIAQWKCNDTDGTTATDTTTTNSGSGTYTATTGKVNGGFQFNGGSDFITIPYNSAFQFGSGDFSMSAWIYNSGGNSYTGFILGQSIPGSGAGSVILRLLNGNISLMASADGTSWGIANIAGTTTLDANKWYHICLVRSGGTWTVYLDGVSEISVTGASADPCSITDDFIIGKQNYSSGVNFFNGKLDDVRIYGRALAAGDIATLATGTEVTDTGTGTETQSYTVSISTDGTSWTDLGVIPSTSFAFLGLDASTEYHLRVTVTGIEPGVAIETTNANDQSGGGTRRSIQWN